MYIKFMSNISDPKVNKIFYNITTLFVIGIISVVNLKTNTTDPDLWGYLSFGRLFWQSNEFPYHDVFTYLPTLNKWIYHEWLSGVLLYNIYTYAGEAGILLLRYGLGFTSLTFIYVTSRLNGAGRFEAIFLTALVAGFLQINFSAVRATIFTYSFFPIIIYLLEKHKKTEINNYLIAIVIIQILWSNLHGGYVAGLGLIFLYSLGEAISHRPFLKYLITLMISVFASLINPYGYNYWQYLYHALTMPRPLIIEWASIFKIYQVGAIGLFDVAYIASVVIITLLLIIWAKPKNATPILILCVTLIQGLVHYRQICFFLIAAGIFLPPLLNRFLEKFQMRDLLIKMIPNLGGKSILFTGILITISFFYIMSSSFTLQLKIPSEPKEGVGIYYPVNAVKYIEEHKLSGNILTEFDWGEYLIWYLTPQCKIALDGRYETVYEESVTNQYFDFLYRGQNNDFVNLYPVDMVLIRPKSVAFHFLHKSIEWKEIFLDQGSVLFMRQ